MGAEQGEPHLVNDTNKFFGGSEMKKCFLSYWHDVNNHENNGYSVIGYYSEFLYFDGTKEECIAYASANNITLVED